MGLKVGDLEYLVKPLISIDEFESKIDPNAIVVGFYVDDLEPAEDLSQFIEASGYDLMDTEVSPGTDDEGNYVVFVEFLRNKDFPKKIKDILVALASLTGNKEWSFTYYGGHDKEISFSEGNVKKHVRLNNELSNNKIPDEDQDTLEFFKPSLLDDILLDHNHIVFKRYNQSYLFERMGLGSSKFLMEAYDLDQKPLNLDSESLRKCKILNAILGENWMVSKVDDYYIVANNVDDRIILLK